MKRIHLLGAARPADESAAVVLHDEPCFAEGMVSVRPAVAPSTEAVELSLVGSVLADNSLYDCINVIVGPDDFASPQAAAIWREIAKVIEGEVDGITVAEPLSLALQSGMRQVVTGEQLASWAKEASSDEAVVAARARAVRDSAAERRLDVAVQKARLIAAEGRSLEERTADIESALNVAADSRALPVTNIGDAAVAELSLLAERASSGKTGIGITTGFDELDTILAGLHPGQLIVLAARPGIGKTALALGIGLAAAKAGHHTTFASMEMLAGELGKRATSIISGVDQQNLRVGALSESEWEAAVTAAEYLKTLPLDIVDADEVNPSSLTSLCRAKKRQGKLSLLIVDYLQLMDAPAGKNASREQVISAISRALKKLASRLRIPVIVLSQLNRAMESRLVKRPQLSDLRESGAIEQDADVVLFIHREEGDGAEIIVAKQRSGPVGVIPVGFCAPCTRFENRSAVNTYDPLPFAA